MLKGRVKTELEFFFLRRRLKPSRRSGKHALARSLQKTRFFHSVLDSCLLATPAPWRQLMALDCISKAWWMIRDTTREGVLCLWLRLESDVKETRAVNWKLCWKTLKFIFNLCKFQRRNKTCKYDDEMIALICKVIYQSTGTGSSARQAWEVPTKDCILTSSFGSS